MPWWTWLLAGIGLLALEMATPGALFALFFGVGALCVAPLDCVGAPASVQWFAFSALSIGGLATLRGPLLRKLSRRPPPGPELVGEEAVLLEDLAAGEAAKVELRGTTWTARSAAAVTLPRGRRCVVARVDGLTLWLEPEARGHAPGAEEETRS